MLADDLVHALPWYFGAVGFGIWAAILLGLVVLLRRRLRAMAERRREYAEEKRRRTPTRPVEDDRSLGPGTDMERW
jgi:hypothetical protein